MKSNGGFYLTQIKQLQDRLFSKLLTKHGLDFSSSQGRILFVLWNENHLTMSEIGKKTSLANNTLTNVIDRMVKQNYLVREVNPKNRREVIISLTDFAISLKEKNEEVSQEMTKIFYENFNEEEIISFEETLEKLLNNLKQKLAEFD